MSTDTTEPARLDLPPTPELDRQKAVMDKATLIGEFLEWLSSQAITIEAADGRTISDAGWNALLAAFFGIDLDKIEAERRAVLAYLNQLNGKDAP